MDSMTMMPMSSMSMNMNMSMGMDMACPMNMYFHTGPGDCILFKDWKLHDGIGAVGDCVAIIAMGLLRELILYTAKYYDFSRKFRERIPFWFHSRKREKEAEQVGDKESLSGTQDNYRYLTPKFNEFDLGENDDWVAIDYIVDLVFYSFSVIVGYFLMLVFMTYNALLCVSVLVGYAFGRLVFYRKVRSLQRFVRNHTKRQLRGRSVQNRSESDDYAQQSHDHCNLGS